MREIKFRVWDLEDKRFLDPIDCTQLVIRPLSGRVTDGTTTPNVELLQYTGLKDKNGVEIYEGDIVRYKSELKSPFDGRTKLKIDSIHAVVFLEGAFMTQHIKGNSGFHELRYKADDSDGSTLEVIGNIYENPELLEGNQ